MAVATSPNQLADPIVAAVRERLEGLDTEGPADVFGPAFAGYAQGIEIQRVDVDDVVALGESAVALLYQRGRDAAGSWVERRLSAVFAGATAEPDLYPSWVAGLDAASRW
jgi:hypothetical protein